MSHSITVTKGEKGKFKILVNFIQEGVELSSAELANHNAVKLQKRYPAAIIILFNEYIKVK